VKIGFLQNVLRCKCWFLYIFGYLSTSFDFWLQITFLLFVWCAVASSHPSLGRHKNRLNQVLLDEAKKWQQKAMDVVQEELTQWTPDIEHSECSFGMCGGIPNYPKYALSCFDTHPRLSLTFSVSVKQQSSGSLTGQQSWRRDALETSNSNCKLLDVMIFAPCPQHFCF